MGWTGHNFYVIKQDDISCRKMIVFAPVEVMVFLSDAMRAYATCFSIAASAGEWRIELKHSHSAESRLREYASEMLKRLLIAERKAFSNERPIESDHVDFLVVS